MRLRAVLAGSAVQRGQRLPGSACGGWRAGARQRRPRPFHSGRCRCVGRPLLPAICSPLRPMKRSLADARRPLVWQRSAACGCTAPPGVAAFSRLWLHCAAGGGGRPPPPPPPPAAAGTGASPRQVNLHGSTLHPHTARGPFLPRANPALPRPLPQSPGCRAFSPPSLPAPGSSLTPPAPPLPRAGCRPHGSAPPTCHRPPWPPPGEFAGPALPPACAAPLSQPAPPFPGHGLGCPRPHQSVSASARPGRSHNYFYLCHGVALESVTPVRSFVLSVWPTTFLRWGDMCIGRAQGQRRYHPSEHPPPPTKLALH